MLYGILKSRHCNRGGKCSFKKFGFLKILLELVQGVFCFANLSRSLAEKNASLAGSQMSQIYHSPPLKVTLRCFKGALWIHFNKFYLLSIYLFFNCVSGTGPVQKFNQSSRFSFELAINRITVKDGEDCPELAFNGIIDAINIGNPLPGSPMYVFTDAPPKASEDYNRDNAIGYALDYMMPINFFFSTEGCGYPAGDKDYKAIIESTGGLSMFFSSASAIGSVNDLITADLDGSTIISSGAISRSRLDERDLLALFTRWSRDISFPVDGSVEKLIISISARYRERVW